ncbi:MAG: LysR family transcriptional regulator [Gammaproteobacteria bacterium]|nr:LysR family transcriptional regulator [Gammaproteobacteria bacterium]
MEFADLLMVFVRTVEHGSFSATARSMNMSPSAVSKRISGLENRLGVRLLSRSTRRITLTDEGRAFYDRAKRIAAEVLEAEEMVMSMGSRVRGTLRVTATVAMAKAHLLPLFPEFLKRYPELHLVLELTDRPVDLGEGGIDVAIRFTEQILDTSVVARKLLTNRRVICAAPGYLDAHGIPRTPEDLLDHNCLRLWTVASWNDWEFDGPGGARTLRVDGNFEANSADAVYHAALAGLGIARLSTYLVGNDLRSGRLVQLLPEYAHQKANILAVYPDRRNLSPKVRVFVDFLVERLSGLAE